MLQYECGHTMQIANLDLMLNIFKNTGIRTVNDKKC